MAAEAERIAGLRHRLLNVLRREFPGIQVNGSRRGRGSPATST